jgi:2-polyprenyl-3-methyl-5-hydroxy-6-metoxy-1,4-benzoquinol methylase
MSTSAAPAFGSWREDDLETVLQCAICGSSGLRPLYDDLSAHAEGPWRLEICQLCESALLNPRPTPESIGRAYRTDYAPFRHAAKRPSPEGVVEALVRRVQDAHLEDGWGYELERPSSQLSKLAARGLSGIRRDIDREIRAAGPPRQGARLLDVGCATGEYLELMRDLGWDVAGVEADPGACDVARGLGLTVRCASASDVTPDVDGLFDHVTLGHVIEHVHDPVSVLQTIHDVMRPGARLWIATPNLVSVNSRIFRSSWRALDPPRHLVLFNPDSLRLALHRAGFVGVRFVRAKASAGWNIEQSAAVAGISHRRPLQALTPLVNALSHVNPYSSDEMCVTATRA